MNGVTTEYTVVDGTLYAMSDGTNTLQFFDNSVLFNGTEYWYVYNAQNDVIGLINANGECVVEYTYSAYGLPLSKTGSMADTLGTLNPFRYRGYICDEETALYYCNSRYYDSSVGRWLNADKYVATGYGVFQYNMYAYCDNNPVIWVDPNGMWVFYITLISQSQGIVHGSGDSLAIAIDGHFNPGLIYSHSDVATIFTAGHGVALGLDWSADTIEDFASASPVIGGSIGFNIGPVPCYGGVDLSFDSSLEKCTGINLPSGAGVGVDVHAGASQNEIIIGYDWSKRSVISTLVDSNSYYTDYTHSSLRTGRIQHWNR